MLDLSSTRAARARAPGGAEPRRVDSRPAAVGSLRAYASRRGRPRDAKGGRGWKWTGRSIVGPAACVVGCVARARDRHVGAGRSSRRSCAAQGRRRRLGVAAAWGPRGAADARSTRGSSGLDGGIAQSRSLPRGRRARTYERSRERVEGLGGELGAAARARLGACATRWRATSTPCAAELAALGERGEAAVRAAALDAPSPGASAVETDVAAGDRRGGGRRAAARRSASARPRARRRRGAGLPVGGRPRGGHRAGGGRTGAEQRAGARRAGRRPGTAALTLTGFAEGGATIAGDCGGARRRGAAPQGSGVGSSRSELGTADGELADGKVRVFLSGGRRGGGDGAGGGQRHRRCRRSRSASRSTRRPCTRDR